MSVGDGKAAEYRLKLNTAALTFGNWRDGGHTRRDRYEEAKRKAKKHNKPIQGRLCDYVRHEVSEMLKKNRGIV